MQMIQSIPIPSFLSDVFSSPDFSPGEDGLSWVCDKVTQPDQVDKRVVREKPTSCLRYLLEMSRDMQNPTAPDTPCMNDDNDSFIQSLGDLFVIIARQGNRLSVGEVLATPEGTLTRAEIYSFTALDMIRRMSFRYFVRTYGLPREYVAWDGVLDEGRYVDHVNIGVHQHVSKR